MKKIIYSVSIIALLLTTIYSCRKSTTTLYYEGVSIKHDETYGTYLSFDTKEHAEKIVNYLDSISVEQRKAWEAKLNGFVSVRASQGNTTLPMIKDANGTLKPDHSVHIYSDIGFASVINPKGYFMIESVLYRDKNENETYKIINDSEIRVDDNATSTRACHNNSKTVYKTDMPCAYYAQNQRELRGDITYSAPLIGTKKIILRSELRIANCGSWNWVTATCSSIGVQYSYNVTCNGSTLSGVMVNSSSNNSWYNQVILCQGSNICLGYVITTHFATRSGSYISKANDVQ